ncbi:MAG: Crp/Fnr family transcriptional regulator [Rikenellaceae bacterium]|nr:Crp/Fnr family transcriptional regulator [Rikenellaceae bacterium]
MEFERIIPGSEIIERLFSLFPLIDEKGKGLIRNGTTVVPVAKGCYIYDENDSPMGFLCLMEGNAKVVKTGINGRGSIVRLVKPMGLLGYRALFAEENYRSAAIALDDSLIAIVNKEAFFEVMRSNADFSLHILKLIAGELGESHLRMVTLTQKYLRGRLADAILSLADIYGFAEDGKTIPVTLSRSDLAQLSSMTTSNAIRTFSSFISEGFVANVNKRIAVLDLEGLHKVSELG